MDFRENKMLLCLSLAYFIASSSASLLFEQILNDVDPCQEVCQKTYPMHTYEKSSTDCCLRGCRLYSIIELIAEEGGVNGTRKSCHDNCKEAYPGDEEETSACVLGCDSQKSVSRNWGPMGSLDVDGADTSMSNMMYPLMYMHNMYSNMAQKMAHHMSVSWSFYMQDGNGRLVVVQSQPQSMDVDVQDFDDYSSSKGTSTGMETNIEASDNTATEIFRHSQLKSVRSLGDEMNAMKGYPWRDIDDSINTDWLTCIAYKTGVPRLLLCVCILLSAVAMIWLCMSAAVTAPDQKITQQKLSINGDLSYLRHLMEKRGLKSVHPQDFVEARPLPVKIRVEQI